MTTLTLHLSNDVYQRLAITAERLGKPLQIVAQEWLATLQPPPPANERERGREILRAAGLLTELGPDLKKRADSTISLHDVREALTRAEGPSLSDIVLEQRRLKEW